MIKPNQLKKGDKVAIVSLSWGGLGDQELIHKYYIAKERLEIDFGLEVVVMPHALKGSDAKHGGYRYESRFALPVFGDNGEVTRYNVFHVAMILRHAEDGKKYLYDIMNIKKEMSSLFQP